MKRLVIVTGASRGLGYALAQEFLSGGYDVVITAQNDQALKSAQEKLNKAFSSQLYAFPMDFNDTASIDRFCTSVFQLGYTSLILVNNAGLGHVASVDELKEEDLQKIFNVNFFGPFKLINRFFPLLKKEGAIINIFSILALRPIKYWALYSSAKSAFSTFAISLQMEYEHHGIKIFNVFPSKMKTDFTGRSLGNEALKGRSVKEGVCPNVLAQEIYKHFMRKGHGQFFYPWSMRLLFILHSFSIDLTSTLLNFLLKKNGK